MRACVGHEDQVWSVSWSPDGKTLASASQDQTVRLWDPATGKQIRACAGDKGNVESVTWSPGGKTLASAGQDWTVRLWDSATGKEIRACAGHKRPVWSVSWSPDGKTLASAGEDGTIRLWDPATGKEIRACAGDKGNVESVTWSPDGKTLASAGNDKTVRLWDAATGKEIRVCAGHEEWVRSVTWSPDGKTLASASHDRTIRLWDAASGKEIRSLATNHAGFESVAFSPDGRRLASANSDTTILIWAVPSVPLVSRKLTGTDLSSCWADLGGKVPRSADDAMWTLVAAPEQSVPFLKTQLRPVRRDPKLAEKLVGLIAALDSDDFATRENASVELGKLGLSAEAAMRKALESDPSEEVKRRLTALLEPLAKNCWTGMPLQDWHALGVLERIGSEEARQVLKGLSEGDPNARLTQEARAALERLRKHKAGQSQE
jgi:uncharacterized protein with WD repeat